METIITERENGSRRVQYSSNQPSKVDPSHRDRCNINTIMRKAKKGHYIPIASGQAVYGDFTSGEDFHTTQNKIIDAADKFMQLPSEIRNYFDNDPGKLIDFLENEENRKKAIEIGLIEDNKNQVLNVSAPPDGPQKSQKEPLKAENEDQTKEKS